MSRYFYLLLTVYLIAVSSSLSAQDYIRQRYDRQRIIMPVLGSGCNNLDSSNHVYINGVRFDFRSDSLQMIAVDTFVSQAIIPYYTINERRRSAISRGRSQPTSMAVSCGIAMSTRSSSICSGTPPLP